MKLSLPLPNRGYLKSALQILAFLIILLGVGLRIIVYVENRNLSLDEANLARNLFEHSYTGLTGALPYGTFAPIPFLWITKACSNISWGEWPLKLYPFLCGLCGFLLFWNILKKLIGRDALLYPLMMVATGLIFIRYTSELKQYSSDFFITLAIIWMALKVNIASERTVRFNTLWCLVGGLAIWASMPAIFVLSGVALYYAWEGRYDRQRVITLIPVVCFWGLQFVLYYFLTLKQFIASSYLQNYHEEFFLSLFPRNLSDWSHNGQALNDFLTAMWGKYGVAFGLNLLSFAVGGAHFVRREKRKAFLLLTPIIAVLVAAGLHKYTLLARVMLFAMPIVFIIIGKGFEIMLRVKFLNLLVTIAAIVCIVNYSEFGLLIRRCDTQEIVPSLKTLKEDGITGNKLFIIETVFSNYIYYSSIHPDAEQWITLRGARQFEWNTRMDSLASGMPASCAFMYGTIEESLYNEHKAQIASVKQIDHEVRHLETKLIFCR